MPFSQPLSKLWFGKCRKGKGYIRSSLFSTIENRLTRSNFILSNNFKDIFGIEFKFKETGDVWMPLPRLV